LVQAERRQKRRAPTVLYIRAGNSQRGRCRGRPLTAVV